jgi:hypothetical protein
LTSDPVIALTLRHDGRNIAVELQLETFRPLVGELRLSRPKLAAAVQQAGRGYTAPSVDLHDGDVAAIAVAARVLRESLLLDDPALEQLAEL